MYELSHPVTQIPGIGPSSARKLAKLGISTLQHLLYHLPLRYADFTHTTSIKDAPLNTPVTIFGHLLSLTNFRTHQGKQVQKGVFTDGVDQIEVIWFNRPFLTRTLKPDTPLCLSGKITLFRTQKSFSSPQFEIVSSPRHQLLHTAGLTPIHPLTTGLTDKWLRSRIRFALDHTRIDDWLPPEIITRHHLVPLKVALEHVHFPPDPASAAAARRRLGFNELLLFQLSIHQLKRLTASLHTAPACDHLHHLTSFQKDLPFTLTPDQLSVIRQIYSDMAQDRPMNRLVQGDVGSGKTAVAAAAIYLAVKNGLTGVLMAPTQVLAEQHHRSFRTLLPDNLPISLQTSAVRDDLNAPVIIGTHALLHRRLPENIGLVIIDEQHRFGVNQRTALLNQDRTPHILSTTATPIPRTIALTLYADLDLSCITTMPPGRIPVKTWVVPTPKRQAAYDWIKDHLNSTGSQAFIVCPFIEASTDPQLEEVKSVKAEFDHIRSIFSSFRVDLLHGHMSAASKRRVIDDLVSRRTDILVTTPVIEVGIDIPRADIILIESAQRFGLAALHQLRGRVGRSGQQGYCLLFTDSSRPSPRLQLMRSTHHGLKLAQADLKLRGPGQLLGTRQSGFLEFQFADLSDLQLVHATHRLARRLIDQDPHLSNLPHLNAALKSSLEIITPPH